MSYVLGIGDDKNWEGIEINSNEFKELGYDYNYDFLWSLKYSNVKNTINFLSHGNTRFYPAGNSQVAYKGLKAKNSIILTNEIGAVSSLAFIYDKKGNVYILAANGPNNKDYELLDKYKLKNKPPDWKKIDKIGTMIYSLSFEKRNNKLKT